MDLRDKLSSMPGNPRKVLKIVVGLAFALLLMWLLTLSHIAPAPEEPSSKVITTEQTSDSMQTDDSTYKSLIPKKSTEESSSMLSNGLVTFFVLLVLLVLVWFWVDKKGGGSARGQQREIDSELLGEGASMKIMKVNDEIWVLGVTAQTVNLLHRYPEEEWTEMVPKQEEGSDRFAKLFKSKL